MIKSYTSLEQSRKLAEILPIDTADMFHFIHGNNNSETIGIGYEKASAEFYSKTKFEYIPCWSLAALLGVLPKPKIYYSTDKTERWYCECWNSDGDYITFTKADNPIDACVAMIEKLHELNLL